MIEGLQSAVSAWSRLWEKGKELSQKNTKKTKEEQHTKRKKGNNTTLLPTNDERTKH
jgi:hypothetical protein